ncbi:MAG TPA: TrkA C-terminal domain-containing protein, partial [candidate division Zixibacteria bacterium]|nr:TrkA C-terminal domain-containing protein [candidate division Zixibacteria bacterium]
DQDNLIICQMAKILYYIPKTIARVNDPKNEEMFQTLGVDSTVSATRIIGSLIEEKIDPGLAIPLMALKGGVELFQTQLSADSMLIDKKIAKLKLPEDFIIVAILRGNDVVIPKGDTILQANDTVMALAKKEGKEAFQKLFL